MCGLPDWIKEAAQRITLSPDATLGFRLQKVS